MAEENKTQDKQAEKPAESQTPQTESKSAQADGERVKVEYTKSTAQRDLEERYADDATPVFREAVDPSPVDENGFVGVSPEYANYANDTDKPLEAEDGVFADAEQAFVDSYNEPKDTNKQTKENYDAVTHGAQSLGVNQK